MPCPREPASPPLPPNPSEPQAKSLIPDSDPALPNPDLLNGGKKSSVQPSLDDQPDLSDEQVEQNRISEELEQIPPPRPASPELIDPDLQAAAQALFPELAKDLYKRKQQPLSQSQTKEARSGVKRPSDLGGRHTDHSCINAHRLSSKRPWHESVEELLQNRIPASEKKKWVQVEQEHPKLSGSGRKSDTGQQLLKRDLFDSSKTVRIRSKPNSESRSLMASTESGEEEEGWTRVMPSYWWRKNSYQPHSNSESKMKQANRANQGSQFFKKKVEGKCFNCLSPNHIASFCHEQARCWFCLHTGHKAGFCPRRSRHNKDTPLVRLSPTEQTRSHPISQSNQSLPIAQSNQQRSFAQVVRGDDAMAVERYPGDPRARPARAFCAVKATRDICQRRDKTINRAVVCWFDGNSHDVDTFTAGNMIRDIFGLRHGEYQVVKHFPEQFLIKFASSETRNRAVHRGWAAYRGRVYNFEAWDEQRYAIEVVWEFRVKVRVEGIPVHCWSEEVAALALGKSCAIHYVQERTQRQERTRSFDLWSWCNNPSDIPKEVTLTVTVPDREMPSIHIPLPRVDSRYDNPTDLKLGHKFNLRNHLEVVQDLSFLRGRKRRDGQLNRKPLREFNWSYGVPDSQGERCRQSEEDKGRNNTRYYRRDVGDDEDHDHDLHRVTCQDSSVSGWGRDARCRGTEDCMSSTRRGFCKNTPYHSGSYHSRAPPSPRQQVKRWVPKVDQSKKSSRRVSFAEPLITAWWPPKEVNLSADSWFQEAMIESNLGKQRSGSHLEQVVQDFCTEVAKHLVRPLTKEHMEAVLELANQCEFRSKRKKRTGKGKPAILQGL
ncbi:hypothetical protein BS78_09G220600 [Paspalum vaginatum]|nr:hypothetical protein BS78_09G220600 [Paspalum vaginatum]